MNVRLIYTVTIVWCLLIIIRAYQVYMPPLQSLLEDNCLVVPSPN